LSVLLLAGRAAGLLIGFDTLGAVAERAAGCAVVFDAVLGEHLPDPATLFMHLCTIPIPRPTPTHNISVRPALDA
jgi:hypothetical protein